MRDFAKNNSITTAKNDKNKADNKPRQQPSLAIRKIILALLLLVLIIAFIVSFYGSNKSKDSTATTTTQTVHVSPKPVVNVSDAKEQNNQTQNNTTADSKLTQGAKQTSDSNAVAVAPNNENNTKESAATNNKKAKDNKTDNKKDDDQPLTFTFYNTLTNKTVQVDANPEKLKQYRYTYMLQVGSYRNQSDANATRAKLILAGLKPNIKKVGDWYRLDVGPVYSQRDGDVIKHKVESAGISGSILRQVDKEEITQQTSDDNQ
ncbi:SPOR domain-containing protein [Cysteiniphilum sp. QT6929]|uniref:SPOR domain-containing protein n=1 Tax=Cysteiniphilum sp. QT6929 TaxID=2975055 RepID=UPI0024B3503B|nr:SPOR domain-containing protein [Cysteiniphilum sp. QT6929]WHN65183.1 SPOR domain-containing protein [Cysteiniphilum sp. QT6929]